MSTEGNNKNKRDFESPLRHRNKAFLTDSDTSEQSTIRVAFVLFEHFSMMAFTAAVDALVTANLVTHKPTFEVSTFSLSGDAICSDLGIDISVGGGIRRDALASEDIIILCGGYRSKLQMPPLLKSALTEAGRNQPVLGGLWNGSFFLAEAGLLNGYNSTIHPENRALFGDRFPDINLLKQPVVIDRDRISCAGASSSLDMMLELIKGYFGPELVRGIREILSCDKIGELPDKPMAEVSLPPTLPESLKTMLELMENNIEEPLSMTEIASYVDLSRRQVERLFLRHVDTTPSKYYLELRITRARQLLLQSNESIANIAVACGFVSTTHFSHCFRDYFGQSPTQARRSLQDES
ncbi:GlxA family transcriptional regulator [Marinobacterium jannaschii]|uniref:GlxA family transcriptional regulator n=1 Tax=Marinobacterium jannaschii TaxID=64970 RepID=UPI00048909BC|nr:GlxA family transcriptional regulator [Marinobacterium jannaschii]